MQFLQSVLLVLLFSYDALCAPAPTPTRPQRQNRSFKVDRVFQGAQDVDGSSALNKAYRKHGIKAADSGINLDLLGLDLGSTRSQDASQQEQTGEVRATSKQGDAMFVSPVTIGGQTIVMDFDTGSADFWVMNTRLPSDQTAGHTVFDPSRSSTYKDLESYTFNITYGDNSYSYGGVGKDTVEIGGASVTEQAVGIPTEVSSYFTDTKYSNGLVGLGFSSLSMVQPKQQKTFFENLADSLDEPVFTALLKTNGVGEYEFGRIDHTKYLGSLVNVSVDSSAGFWQFESKLFSVAGSPFEQITTAPTSTVDSGTSLMLVSPEVAGAYYAQVAGASFSTAMGGYIFPCQSQLPDFSIAIGPSYLATVPGSYINYSGAGQNTTTGEDMCYGGLQSSQVSSMQILGDVFMKALFVVFDMRGPSLAIACPNYQ